MTPSIFVIFSIVKFSWTGSSPLSSRYSQLLSNGRFHQMDRRVEQRKCQLIALRRRVSPNIRFGLYVQYNFV
jgi:hypothetical protein